MASLHQMDDTGYHGVNTCPIVSIEILMILELIIGIMAFFVSMSSYGNTECFTPFHDVSLEYTEWLALNGVLMMFISILSLLIGWSFYHPSQIYSIPRWGYYTYLIFSIAGHLFLFAWYIVGVILFFNVVTPSCSVSNLFYVTGWIVLISQTIVWSGFISSISYLEYDARYTERQIPRNLYVFDGFESIA